MFLNKIRNIFCVPETKFVSATNVARAGKRGKNCVGNNVASFARAFSITTFSLLFVTLLYNVTNDHLRSVSFLDVPFCFSPENIKVLL